ncbi:sulfotransferase [Nitrosomonas sp. Nm166]|uniref:sulfotransferase family protein n=1 Tax=Nitrosomonas sp. Nm166 TaxID=1881054 RepID=UPI0015A59B1E|nr:sulfotransferase [Nitrosomonas sp. Nm166]
MVKSVDCESIFVMGLPRSGSTLISRLLNNSPDILSVNDLYFLQAVLAMDATSGELSHLQIVELVDLLLNVINVRSNVNEEFIGQLNITPESIQRIRQEVLSRQKHKRYEWHDLMNDLLSLVSADTGKSRWADKTPQNFYHFYLLAERFPKARFIFLFRDPRSILASYKYASGEGHDIRRYHPVVYSLYWRSAVRFYQRVKDHPRVIMLRYEDLLSDTVNICAKLGEFLCTDINLPELTSLGHNSSFSKGDRKSITTTESWICERLCSSEMNDLCYGIQSHYPKISDVPYLLKASLQFSTFQTLRAFNDKEARKRIITFIRGLGR